MIHSFLSAALVALAVALANPAAAANDGSAPTPPGDQSQTPEAAPDDGELTSFVTAFVRLIGVQHGYMVLMQNEQDPSQLEAIKQNAMEDMTAAVEQDGLSVDRYNQIALAVREDPQLQGRVETILEQLAAAPDEQPAPEGE